MDTQIANIIKAIAYTENGGKPNVNKLKSGKSGETKSMLQFMPATWKEYSKQTSGQDNLPMTPENEALVTYHKVGDWLNSGYSPEQIFSMWNSGRPDAYKQGVKGVNSKGIKYDTPSYVKKATNFLSQFNKETQKNPTDNMGQVVMQNDQSSGMIPQSSQTPPQSGLIAPQMKQIKQARPV